MSIRSLLLLTIWFGPAAHGELLAPGKLSVHQGFGARSASSLWAGATSRDIGSTQSPSVQSTGTQAATPTGPSSGNVLSLVSTTSASIGLPRGFQIDASLEYMYSSLAGGSEGGRVDGDFERGLSEIGVRLNKSVYDSTSKKDLGLGFSFLAYSGVRTPGNAPPSGDKFLALNDGTTKFDFGAQASLTYGKVGLSTDFTLIVRANRDLANQFNWKTKLPLTFLKGVTFGPALQYFNTLEGIDIDSAEFAALAKKQGGAPPYSSVKQEYLAVEWLVAVPVGKQVTLDGFVSRRVTGRNTDVGTGVGLGVGLGF
jgi:hypothetical protein